MSAMVVALLGCAAGAATVMADEAASAVRAVAPAPARDRVAATLDARVRLLSKELDLDTRQQGRLRVILERQRDAVRKIWSDNTLLPAERGPAVRGVIGRTADQTRAILTDAQRKKYNPPKPPASPSAPGQADVGVWMEAIRSK
jgi:hypothetical protein